MSNIPNFGELLKSMTKYVDLGYSKGWDYGIIGIFAMLLLVILWNLIF